MTATICPSLVELLVSDAELSLELAEHLETCQRCRTLRRHLLERAERDEIEVGAPELAKEPSEREAGAPEPVLGGVYAIHGPLTDEYLIGALVDWDEEEAVVVPLSDAVRFSTNWDLLLERALLGYEAMAEVWNHGTALVEQLEEKLGELGPWTDALEAVYAAALESALPPTKLSVGPPVLDEADPRLLFQEQEGERAAIYWQPATLLAGVESLGELVHLQREELGLGLDELGEIVEPPTLETLEAGKLDLFHQLPSEALIALMKRLAVDPSRRLKELIRQGVESTFHDPLDQTAGLAVYRKRRGMRKSAPPPADKSRVAEQYANEVIEGMKR